MEYIDSIIETTLNSFDLTYCVVVNVLTYLSIQMIEDSNGAKLTTWKKRLVTFINIIFVGVAYIFFGMDYKLLFNSAILAPVFWSWLGKPLIKYFSNKLNG